MEASATRLREQIDKLVVLGIGGSYMGLRALFEGLCDPYHNQRTRTDRRGCPKLFYDGNNLDNDFTSSLLNLLMGTGRSPREIDDRWGIVVISKSGGTLETAAAFRAVSASARTLSTAGFAAKSRELVIPITGESGKLPTFVRSARLWRPFPVPDGIGGRFSVFTAVGLFPAAVLGIDMRALLQGAADMTERFTTAPLGDNPVLDYVATCHLLERDRGATIRVLSTWGKRLEAVGLWYDQLLAESLGQARTRSPRRSRSSTPAICTAAASSIRKGRRDKLITNVIVEGSGDRPGAGADRPGCRGPGRAQPPARQDLAGPARGGDSGDEPGLCRRASAPRPTSGFPGSMPTRWANCCRCSCWRPSSKAD